MWICIFSLKILDLVFQKRFNEYSSDISRAGGKFRNYLWTLLFHLDISTNQYTNATWQWTKAEAPRIARGRWWVLYKGKRTAEKSQMRCTWNYNRVQEPRQAQLMDFGVMQTWVRILLLPFTLCDFGQVTYPAWASVSSSTIWSVLLTYSLCEH